MNDKKIISFKIRTVTLLMGMVILLWQDGRAQDVLPLTGEWQIQPAAAPGVPPDQNAWSITKAVDLRMSWVGNTTAGQHTSWANVPHDAVNSLWYSKRFTIPSSWQGKRVIINFRRIEGDAIIFLNNKRVAELLRPGGDVDLTEQVEVGKENVLAVFITRDYTGISRNFINDPLRYQVRQANGNAVLPMHQRPMGITAPVTIMAKPAQFIADVFCIASYRTKTIQFEVEINGAAAMDNCYLQADIVDEQNTTVLSFKSKMLQLQPGRATYTISSPWTNPTCWELEKPYLYKVQVKLVNAANDIDRFKEVRFGFREIWAVGKDMYMNGHLLRWRLTDLYGANKNGLSFYRQMGYNVGQVQPHSNLWWGQYVETPLMDEEMLDEMDRIGMGCTLPAPSVAKIRGTLLNNAQAKKDYAREVEYYLKYYRNHPCIFAWVVAMNSANPKSNIWPATMGKRDTVYMGQAKVIDLACSIIKQTDSTRFAFAHADGSVGDVSSANVYLNFAPLQEREDWPMEWAKHGNMPYSAIEFGPPYWNNFWKGSQFLLTEYLSMYQGDEAYHREQEHGLRTSIDKGLHASGTTWEQLDFNDYPSFWDYQRLFTRNTNRSWRTWGINAGWLYWLLEGYGDPPGEKRRFTSRYKLASPLTSTPSWVNPRYEIFKDANQPLLAYIAGYPLHTDKTHTFFSGEAIKKQIAVVWDGSEQKQLQAEWKVLRDGAVIQKGNSVLPVEAGGIRLYPIEFTAPAVQQRQLLKLVLSVKDKNSEVQRDTLLIDVFAKPINKQQVTVAVYDPLNKSVNWLKQLRVNAVPWKKSPGSGSPEPGRKKFAANILIIGREALKTGMQLPYTAKDVANGLKVIILEQQPDVWEGMGFQTIETMPRYVFIRDAANPVIKGLLPRDFINWRGSPDLLPEGKYARTYDVQKAPKWTNTHAVASVVIKTPEVVGFTPVLQTEFDMAYSLLLEWRYGKGMVTFCTIDLTGRAGVDPVATLLAANLLKRQLMTLPATKKIYYAGDTKGKSLMDIIGVQQSENISTAPGNAIIVAGNGEQAMTNTAANAFVVKGGCVFYLPQSKSELAAQGFITNEKEIIKVAATGNSGLLRAIGPNFLRWKDVLSTNVFSLKGQPGQGKVLLDGIALEQNVGKGKLVHVQVGPALLSSRYEDSVQKKESIQLSVIRLNQLTAQLLTNLGASPADAVAERLTIVAAPQTYQTLGTWKVLGPYTASTANGETTVNTVYAGEQDAIEGGENPNNTHRTTDGKLLDWRKVVNADKNGFIDLRKAFPEADELAVAYVTKSITSAGNQTAVLRLGVDFWMEAWLNGKSIVKVTQAHQKRENEYVLQVPLQKGENILTLKVASGRGGFGFWANMSVPSNDNTGNSRTTAVTSMPLYSPLFKYFDPYQFSYW